MRKILVISISVIGMIFGMILPIYGIQEETTEHRSYAEIVSLDQDGNIIDQQTISLNDGFEEYRTRGVIRYGEKTSTYTCVINGLTYFISSFICRYKNEDNYLTYVSDRVGTITNGAALVGSITKSNYSVIQDGNRDINKPLQVSVTYAITYSYNSTPNVSLPATVYVFFTIY